MNSVGAIRPASFVVVSAALLIAADAWAADSTVSPTQVTTGPNILYAPLMMDYYTPEMRKAGEAGNVRFKVCIDARGKITTAEMLESSGFDRLDQTATKVVQKYRFKAGTVDGVPTGSCFGIRILFKPPGEVPVVVDGKLITHAQLLSMPNLSDYYPKWSVDRQEEGIVRVRVCFDIQGSVTGVSLDKSSGFPNLDDAGLAMARQFRFKAGTIDGVPQADCLVSPINFHIFEYRNPAQP